ncbi:nucleotidyltransferase substrate binding protein [Hippea jasoniae]|uniref:nucleotidyltransferase substrate binding protein n=1 Tax=Hippea jasoniae TaxID=944479 RepID=UPI000A6EE3D8|nr:nucleotidyltransferase substrate binding protein [Hippea jasoniae]
MKSYLREIDGIECRSPKSCVREFFSAGYMKEKDVVQFLKMIDDRNLTSHTYREEVAEELFSRFNVYLKHLKNVLEWYKNLQDPSQKLCKS